MYSDKNKSISISVRPHITLSKTLIVSTSNYDVSYNENVEYENGEYVANPVAEYDIKDIELHNDFNDQHYHPLYLLKEYADLLKKEKQELETLSKTPQIKRKISILQNKIDDCSGWEIDEEEIEQV